MKQKDLSAKALVNLGSIWEGLKEVRRDHGVGPGCRSSTAKNSKGTRSLRKFVEREASKCSRGFNRMATVVRRTEDLITEEFESLKQQKAAHEARRQAELRREAEKEALRRKLAGDAQAAA